MSKPIKFLFDENYGKPLVRALGGLLNLYSEKPIAEEEPLPPPIIKSVHEIYESGSDDEVWIPKIAPEGWVLISCDRAKRCGGKKLPSLCKKHGVTHVLVSGLLHDAKQFEKARAVIVVWNELILLRHAPLGSRFSLRYSQNRHLVLVPFGDGSQRHQHATPVPTE